MNQIKNQTLDQLLQDDLQDADIQIKIGCCYRNGKGTLQNHEEAVSWFRKAAKQGEASAWCLLGNACFEGAGMSKDYAAAYRYYSQAQGFRLQPKLYRRFYDEQGNVHIEQDFGKNPGILAAVGRGSVAAMTALGNCYFLGHGTAVDYETATQWYEKAAEKGDVEALWALGYAYVSGAGVKRDCNRGLALFQEAARDGFLPALHNLSQCYAHGCGTPVDQALAAEYAAKAKDLVFYGNYSQRFYTPKDYYNDCRSSYLSKILEKSR